MQFCEECGSMMRPVDGEMVCSNCGHAAERTAEGFVSTESQRDADVIESTEESGTEGMPTATDVVCDRCGHDEAWYTIKQTASADEPPTRFFKCKECGYRWREYN